MAGYQRDMRVLLCALALGLGAMIVQQAGGGGRAAAATPHATTTPLVEQPEGQPNHPLTNLPSTTLAGVGRNAAPGQAFFESARDGIVVRVSTLADPTPSMKAEIDKGACPNGGPRMYALKGFAGNQSTTTLRGARIDQVRKPGVVIRIISAGKTIDCGTALGKEYVKTRG